MVKTFKLSSSAIKIFLKCSFYENYNLYMDSEELGFSASFHRDLDGGTLFIRHMYTVSGKGQLPLLPDATLFTACCILLMSTVDVEC